MTRVDSGGRAFETWILAFCDRFLADRTFELVVAPALADCEFESALGRQHLIASRVAILRAVIGGWLHDARNGAGSFLKLTLLSVSYFTFPVAMSVKMHETWEDFFVAVSIMLVLSLAPVIACFWPGPPNARSRN